MAATPRCVVSNRAARCCPSPRADSLLDRNHGLPLSGSKQLLKLRMTTQMRWAAIAAFFLLGLGVLAHAFIPRYVYHVSSDGLALVIHAAGAGGSNAACMTRTGSCRSKRCSCRSEGYRRRHSWLYHFEQPCLELPFAVGAHSPRA
jgi:hypothetical protein